MKVTYLPAALQAAMLVTTGLLISTLAGAALRPMRTNPAVPFCPHAAFSVRLARERTLFEPRPGFGLRTATASLLWRVDDHRDRENNDNRHQGNIGDRGNSGNFGDRGNYGNFGDRGVGGDRGNYGDRSDNGENRDH